MRCAVPHQVDEALKELQAAKGPACGARVASKSGQADLVPTILRLRGEMQRAVEEERCGLCLGGCAGVG